MIDENKKPHIIIGFCGSVATVKLPEIALKLLENAEIRLIGSSEQAFHFLNRCKCYNSTIWSNFIDKGCSSLIIYDSDEWNEWNKLGDTVLHIELRKWADVILIAPASGDFISKASIGLSYSLLLSVLRAWDFSKPCLLCPAMNTMMWDHPSTVNGLNMLKSWGWIIIEPTIKLLACNETGKGALASVEAIVEKVNEIINKSDFKSNLEVVTLPKLKRQVTTNNTTISSSSSVTFTISIIVITSILTLLYLRK